MANKQGDQMQEELTVAELARRKKVSRTTIYNWIGKGCPMVTKYPKRFYLKDVNKWLNSKR